MLLINSGFQEWHTETLRAEFRAAPGPGQFGTIIPAGRTIWTPPVRALIRGVSAVIDTGDPLVAAAGATTVNVSTTRNGTFVAGLFIVATTFAAWNTAGGLVRGWGIGGPAAGSGNGDGGILMHPANGFFIGETQGATVLSVGCDAGTGTGTLLLAWQWRPF